MGRRKQRRVSSEGWEEVGEETTARGGCAGPLGYSVKLPSTGHLGNVS